MSPKDILFRVNDYDQDGDISERGVFLCYGAITVKVAGSIAEFSGFVRDLASHMEAMLEEVEQNYSDGEAS
jgi:hypothetical protein